MKKWSLLILILLAMFNLTNYSFAANSNMVDGKPRAFHPKQIQGYFIWHDDNGLHIRVTTTGQKHIFSGTIQTDGRLEDVVEKSLDENDFSHLKNQNKTIDFHFTSSGQETGIDFYVYRGEHVDFDLSMDSQKISPIDIYLGKDGWHPGKNQFTIYSDQTADGNTANENHTIVIWHFGGFWGPHHGWYHRR